MNMNIIVEFQTKCCVQRCNTPEDRVAKLYFNNHNYDTSAFVLACNYHKSFFRESFPYSRVNSLDLEESKVYNLGNEQVPQ